MSNRFEIVIDQQNKLVRRDICEKIVDVNQHTFDALAVGVMRYLRGAIQHTSSIGDVFWNLALDGSDNAFWTARLPKLILRCPWRMHEGHMVPVFNSTTDPVMSIDWVPPMPVYICFNERATAHTLRMAWLFCVYGTGFYRLPLPNTYADGKLCMGRQEAPVFRSSSMFLQFYLENFGQTEWNADLWNETDKTYALLRFRSEGSKFIAVPPTQSWLNLVTQFTGDQTRYFLTT